MESVKDLPVMLFTAATDWEQWLAAHHTQPTGIWVKFAKKNSGQQSMSYAEAVDGALCYGWIDGQALSYDEQYYLQKFTPRRAKSIWSQINVGKATALIAAGKMQPAGLTQIEAAKQDGRWERAYASPSTTVVPEDLQQALDKDPAAKDAFAALSKTNRYYMIWDIQAAKRPQTRQARIEKYVALLAAGKPVSR